MVPEYADADIRELIEEPYRIIHIVQDERIDVLAVMHMRQLLPIIPMIFGRRACLRFAQHAAPVGVVALHWLVPSAQLTGV